MLKVEMKKVKPLKRPGLYFRANGRSKKINGPEMAFDSGLSFLLLWDRSKSAEGAACALRWAPC